MKDLAAAIKKVLKNGEREIKKRKIGYNQRRSKRFLKIITHIKSKAPALTFSKKQLAEEKPIY